MSEAARINLKIRKGETFGRVLRWGQGVTEYAEITNVVARAPLLLTAPEHGIPDGWVARIEAARGIRGLNTDQYLPITAMDENTVKIRNANGAMLRGEYEGGGYLVYNKPVDLTGYTARMQIREYMEADEPLLTLTTEDEGIVIDVEKSAVAIQIMHDRTEGLPYYSGVYDLEMIAPGGQVHALASGTVEFTDEVTR